MQWLSTPDHQCIDPLYLWVISWNPSSAFRSRDLNLHTDAVRFGILSVPDRGVILLGAEEAGAPGGGAGLDEWLSPGTGCGHAADSGRDTDRHRCFTPSLLDGMVLGHWCWQVHAKFRGKLSTSPHLPLCTHTHVFVCVQLY